MPVRDYTREFDPAALMEALGYEADFDSPAKARARAAALRGRPEDFGQESAAGMGGMMLRGPTAGRVSQALYTSGERGKKAYADQVDTELGTGREARRTALTATMQNMKDKRAVDAAAADDARAEAHWQAEQRLRQAAEARASRAAEQGKWVIQADPVRGGFVRINTLTGEARAVDVGELQAQAGGGAGPQQPMGPGGVQLAPLQQAPGKPPTEAESKTGMRGGVSTNALQVAQGVVNRNPDAGKPGVLETAGTLFGLAPEQQQLLTQFGGGPERGVVRSAVEGFVDSALTEITGAAYTPAQLATYRARFLPTILDSPESKQQKTQQMIDFVRQQANAAGRAWTPVREQQLQELVQAINMGSAGGQPQQAAPERVNAPQGPRPGDKYLMGGG